MPNPNPHKARMAKKRTRKPGNLAALQRLLWRALLTAERILQGAERREGEALALAAEYETAMAVEALMAGTAEREMQLRAIHAISQASGQYAKLLEIGELEARIAALEAAQEQGQ